MLACLARNASARPPARLGLPLSGVPRPLSGPPVLLILTALSRGVGAGAAFFPAGLLVGGAGGVALVLTPGRGTAPLPLSTGATCAGGGGGGVGLGASLTK